MPALTKYIDKSLARGLAKSAVRGAVSRDKAVANVGLGPVPARNRIPTCS